MPLYEYRCHECQHCFEALVFNGEAVNCPECQADRLEKLLSVPARARTENTSLPGSCPPGPPCNPNCCRL